MTVCNLSKKFGSFDAVRGLTFGVRDKVGCELWIPFCGKFRFSGLSSLWVRNALVSLVWTGQARRQPSECSLEMRSCQGDNLILILKVLEIMSKHENQYSLETSLLPAEKHSLGTRAWVETVRATCKASATVPNLTQSLRCPSLCHDIDVIKFVEVLVLTILMSCEGVDWERDVDPLCADPRTPKLWEPDQRGAGEAGELRRPHPVSGPTVRPIQRRQQEETQCCPRSYWQVLKIIPKQ